MAVSTIIDSYGQTYSLNPGVITIGPGKSNTIVIDNVDGPDVIAELIHDGAHWVLKPSQENISVSVNDEALNQQRMLRNDDVIKIGDSILRYMDDSSPLAKPAVDVGANIASFRSTGEIQASTTPAPSMPVPQLSPASSQPSYIGVIAQAPPRTRAEAEQQRARVLNEIAQRQALITSLEAKIKNNTTIAIVCLIIGFFVFGILWVVSIVLFVQNGQSRGKITQATNEIMLLQQQLYQLDQMATTLQS